MDEYIKLCWRNSNRACKVFWLDSQQATCTTFRRNFDQYLQSLFNSHFKNNHSQAEISIWMLSYVC